MKELRVPQMRKCLLSIMSKKKKKEKLHNVLVKFKKEPRVKRHWIKMQLIIFSRRDRQFTLIIMNL